MVIVTKLILVALRQPVFQFPEIKGPVFSLKPAESEAVIKRLDQYIRHDQVYKNAEVTLKEVAKALETNTRSLSYVLNHHLDKNFYDYINDFRIAAAKEMFVEDEQRKLTILQVMYEVGFNSKSSFNTQFKNKTGLTPSAFREQLKRT